ncbi:flagellar filament capping protein FliD [Austwickia chelonae]|uniref:flagellar filament capping protein FliD n=1 Tax=Austwickia chelonae TaxID=100225 RepID=UPI000E269FAE|nr:flagellar filament capping protein FliD [Austwickia chelonae]
MAGGMQVSGLTGFDSASIVAKLMSAERLAGDRYVTAQSTSTKLVSTLQNLNGLFKTMGDSAKGLIPDTLLGGASAWQSTSATTSNKDVATAVTGSTAKPTSLSFTVDQLAQAGSVKSDATFASTATFGSDFTFDLTAGAGAANPTTKSFSVTAGQSLADVVDSINKSGMGVTANMVQVSPGNYGLQISSSTTGAGTDVQVSSGTPLGTFANVTTGQDAKIQLGGANGFALSSPSNTFKDVVPGVTVTAASVSTTPVTIDVKSDTTAISDKVKGFVDATNAALKSMKDNTKYDPDKKTSGSLNGESVVRDVQYKLQALFSGANSGALADAGLQIQKDGTLAFDKAKFEAAYTKDPKVVEKAFTDTATKVADLGKQVTNSADGLLTVRIQGEQALLKDYTKQIADFNDRMTLRQSTLSRQFTALETLLSKMQSQGQWLSGQLASLSSSGK